MAAEIERKFLVKEGWRPQANGVRIAQGYLSTVPERTGRSVDELRAKLNTIKNYI